MSGIQAYPLLICPASKGFPNAPGHTTVAYLQDLHCIALPWLSMHRIIIGSSGIA